MIDKFRLFETTVKPFCSDDTYMVETSILFNRADLIVFIHSLNAVGYDKLKLLRQVDTKNPHGGATYCELSIILRELISEWLESFSFDHYSINKKDFKYMFREWHDIKGIDVSFMLSKKQYNLLRLKHPKLHQMIKSSLV